MTSSELGTRAARLFALLILMATQPALSNPGQNTSSTPKPTVYVGDFDLDVIPASASQRAAKKTPPRSPGQPAPKEEPDPEEQAQRLVNLVATDLVQALQQAGYSAQRLSRNHSRPSDGVQIRGIFAEVDKENHWRRAVMRTGAVSGNVQLLVSVANLAKPEQALYEIAHLPGNENKPGAVITLSPYVPLEKFEIDKDASEDLIKKSASRIVADLSALLNANPAAIPR
jgi:uncharacterized protein DUF4410